MEHHEVCVTLVYQGGPGPVISLTVGPPVSGLEYRDEDCHGNLDSFLATSGQREPHLLHKPEFNP